jgi:lipopolysaccharide biosynthesis glycosyltransferase
VLRDLTELFSIDLGASALAAVTDHVLVGILPHSAQLFGPEGNRWKVDEYLTKAVGISCWQRYFNAGLLVMDLKRMRATGVIDRAREFLQRSRGRAINNDQDALNYAVDGKFLELDPRWNCIANYADPSFFETAQGRLQEVGTLWQTPWMLHYAGLKPWNNLAPQAQSTELFWAEALRTKAAWLIIRLFLATIPGLRWIGVSQALWELRNRGPRLNFVQVGWYWILNVTRHFL